MKTYRIVLIAISALAMLAFASTAEAQTFYNVEANLFNYYNWDRDSDNTYDDATYDPGTGPKNTCITSVNGVSEAQYGLCAKKGSKWTDPTSQWHALFDNNINTAPCCIYDTPNDVTTTGVVNSCTAIPTNSQAYLDLHLPLDFTVDRALLYEEDDSGTPTCLVLTAFDSDGTERFLASTGTSPSDCCTTPISFTAFSATHFRVYVSSATNVAGTTRIFEIGIFSAANDNAGFNPMRQAIKELMASIGTFESSISLGGINADSSYTLSAGTYTVFNYASHYSQDVAINDFTVTGGAAVFNFQGREQFLDRTGFSTTDCAITVWEIIVPISVTFTMEIDNIASGADHCYLKQTPAGDIRGLFTTQLGSAAHYGHIYTTASDFDGCSATMKCTVSVIYKSDSYPLRPTPYINPTTIDGYDFTAIVAGPTTVFTNGASTSTFNVNIATLQGKAAGNTLIMGLVQNYTGGITQENPQLKVNGAFAKKIGSINTAGNRDTFEKGAFFLIDDQVASDGLEQSVDLCCGTSWVRPFSSELYQLELGSGWDATKAIKSTMFRWKNFTVAIDGSPQFFHEGITCTGTICSAPTDGSVAPNDVTTQSAAFVVKTSAGAGLQNVAITSSYDNTVKGTDATGFTEFRNVFGNSDFRLTKAGYAAQCVNFTYVAGTPTPTYTYGSNGCWQITAESFTFQTAMLTNEESAGAQLNATAFLVSISPPTQAKKVPNVANFTMFRSRPELVYYGYFQFIGGSPVIIGNLYTWNSEQPNTNYEKYPNPGPSTAIDIGAYVLAAFDQNGTKRASARFVICSQSSTGVPGATGCPSYPIENGASNSTMEVIVREIIRTIPNPIDPDVPPPLTEKTVSDITLNAWAFAADAPILIPNMYWFLIAGLLVACFGIAYRRNAGS